MHFAASAGHTDALLILKSRSKNNELCQTLTMHGMTPLHFASYNGHEDCIEILTEDDDTVEKQEKESNFTPLHCAV